jgi:hypothetical protein
VNKLIKKWVYILALILIVLITSAGIYLIVNAQGGELDNTRKSVDKIINENILMPTSNPTTTLTKIADKNPTQSLKTEQTPYINKSKIGQNPPPESWKDWPVFPYYISDNLKQIYKQGIENGNNQHAFSIFGDCHSLPEVFLGVFDNDPEFVKTFDPSIQETVKYFQGSFDRYRPTVKIGTTEGALLWPLWNDNKEGKCNPNENAVDCELRVHKPSIVIIQVGTHYESRNEQYMITIIEKILDHGAVPIIVTKADNRELDERINETLVKLAAQYELPVWNFWASVQHLSTKGIDPEDDMYLSDEGYALHQRDGIKVLDLVWHELNSN